MNPDESGSPLRFDGGGGEIGFVSHFLACGVNPAERSIGFVSYFLVVGVADWVRFVFLCRGGIPG